MTSEIVRNYRMNRAKGMEATYALRVAKGTIEFEKRAKEVEAAFGVQEYAGLVKFEVIPEEHVDLDDLFGDTFNPKVVTYITPEKLEDEKQAEIDRIDRDGVWGIVSSYYDGEQWRQAESCGGFIGDDFKGSGYDIDAKQEALDALKAVKLCPCCGRPNK